MTLLELKTIVDKAIEDGYGEAIVHSDGDEATSAEIFFFFNDDTPQFGVDGR